MESWKNLKSHITEQKSESDLNLKKFCNFGGEDEDRSNVEFFKKELSHT